MRAVLIHELGPFEKAGVADVPDPQPGPNEVLVEIHAVPVNYVDLVTARGKYQFAPKMPYTPGKGPTGIVCGVGSGVTGLAVGSRVLAMAEYGGYAELVAVDHRQVYRLPDGLSFVAAASMSVAFDTSWMALRDRARLQPGETVLVLGARGAVGGAAVQLAKALGSPLVLAGVSSPDQAESLKRIGADGIIDLSGADLRQSIRDQVHAATGGAGVNVVIDPIGGDAFDGAIRALTWRGRIVVVGFAAGRIPTLKVNYVLLKNIEVSGIQISDYRKRAPELMATCYRELFELVANGDITPPLGSTLPLSEWASALQMIESRVAAGRLVLVPER